MIIDEKFGFKKGDLAAIKTIFYKEECIQKVVLFGSRAMGNFKPGSDVDLALFSEDRNCANRVSGALNDETLLPYKFDILDVKLINNEDLLNHISRVGVLIFEKKGAEI